MRSILKSTITFWLTIIFIVNVAFSSVGEFSTYDGYSMCDVHCHDDSHRVTKSVFSDCLIEDNNSIKTDGDKSTFIFNTYTLIHIKESFHNSSFLRYSLYSRPPPSLS